MENSIDLYLRLISCRIECSQWKRFRQQIGIREEDLENSYHENRNGSLRALYLQVLRKWRHVYKNVSDPRKCLLEALQNIGNAKLAAYVKCIGDADEILRKIFQVHYKTIEFSSLPWLTNFHPFVKENFYIDLCESYNYQFGKETRKPTNIQDIFRPPVLSWKTKAKNIFVKSNQFDKTQKIPRRILIEGTPNSGKSTLANKIAYDWALGKKYVSNYDLVCVLSLKYAFRGLVNTLFEISKSHEINPITISNLLEENQENILVILDDFDEVDNITQKLYLRLLQKVDFPNMTVALICQTYITDLYSSTKSDFIVLNGIMWNKNIFVNGISEKMQGQFISMYSELSISDIIKRLSWIHDEIKIFLHCPLFLLLINAFLEDSQEYSIETVTQFYRNICNFIIKKGLSLDEQVDKIINTLPHLYDWQPFYVRQLQEIGKLEFDCFRKNKMVLTAEDSVSTEKIFLMGFHSQMNEIPKIPCITQYKIIHESIRDFLTACHLQRSLIQKDEEIVDIITSNIKNWKENKKLLYTFLIELCGGLAEFLKLLSPFAFRLIETCKEKVLFLRNAFQDVEIETDIIQASLPYLPPVWNVSREADCREFYSSEKMRLLLGHGAKCGRIIIVSWNLNYPIVLQQTFYVHTLILKLEKFIDYGILIASERKIQCHDLICKFQNDFSISNWNHVVCLVSCIRSNKLSVHIGRQVSSQLIPVLQEELIDGKWANIQLHVLYCSLFESLDSTVINSITDLVQQQKINSGLTLNLVKDPSKNTNYGTLLLSLNKLFTAVGTSRTLSEFQFLNLNTSLTPEINLKEICFPEKHWKILTIHGNIKVQINERLTDTLYQVDALSVDDWTVNISSDVHLIKHCSLLKKLECISELFHFLCLSLSSDWTGYQSIVELKLKFHSNQCNDFHFKHLTKFSNLQSLSLTIHDIKFPMTIAQSVVFVLFHCPVKELEIHALSTESCTFIKKITEIFLENFLKLNRRCSSQMMSSLSSSGEDHPTPSNIRLPKLHSLTMTFPHIIQHDLKELFLTIRDLFNCRGIVQFNVCEAIDYIYPLITNIFHPRDGFHITDEVNGTYFNSETLVEREEYFGEKIATRLSIVYQMNSN